MGAEAGNADRRTTIEPRGHVRLPDAPHAPRRPVHCSPLARAFPHACRARVGDSVHSCEGRRTTPTSPRGRPDCDSQGTVGATFGRGSGDTETGSHRTGPASGVPWPRRTVYTASSTRSPSAQLISGPTGTSQGAGPRLPAGRYRRGAAVNCYAPSHMIWRPQGVPLPATGSGAPSSITPASKTSPSTPLLSLLPSHRVAQAHRPHPTRHGSLPRPRTGHRRPLGRQVRRGLVCRR